MIYAILYLIFKKSISFKKKILFVLILHWMLVLEYFFYFLFGLCYIMFFLIRSVELLFKRIYLIIGDLNMINYFYCVVL